MRFDIRSLLQRALLGCIMGLCLVVPSAGKEAPPAWWSDLPTPPDSEKPATLAQASLLALRALKILDSTSKELADEVRKGLAKGNCGEPKLRDNVLSGGIGSSPLLAEQLVSMAKPFYDVLAQAVPKWLDEPDSGMGQLQLNDTKDSKSPLNYYPWPQVWPDRQATEYPVNSGQLMKVFALRFESLTGHKPFKKLSQDTDLTSILNNSVDQRLAGLDGGEAQMAVFSIYDHFAEAYSRNENLWCADLAKELTGVTVFKGGPGNHTGIADSYGGVLITRRHILFCNHAHPAYPGSPPPWINGLGFRVRFITAENEVIERELIWGLRVEGQDLWLGLLDEDLPETVKSYRIFPKIDGLGTTENGAVEVGFSQGSSRLPPAVNSTKFQQLCGRCETSHYGTHTEVEGVKHYQQVPMIYVSNLGAADCTGSKGPELRAPFRYCVWDGDSGTPRFHLFGSELLLSRIVLTAGGGGLTLGDKLEKLNETIVAVDREAVEQEKIEKITEYQVTTATPEELEAGVPAN